MVASAAFTLGTLVADIVHGGALVFAFSAFGALIFLAAIAPPAMAGLERAEAGRRSRVLASSSLALAVVGEACWLVAESCVLAGNGVGALLAAVPVVVQSTRFGHLVLAQAALLAAAFFVLGRAERGARPVLAAVLSGIAVLLDAGHLHAAAMDPGPSFFLACEALHVFAAAAWLGSLLPLALFIRAAPPRAGLAAARRYSAFAKPAVVALIATAAWQGLILVGSLPAFVDTPYGRVVMVKIVLFAILIGLALRHRFQMVPALAGADRDAVRRQLGRSVLAEAAFGVAIVLVAAVLASLAPPAMTAMDLV